GVQYVFEGSANGGTIIAKRIKDVLGLDGERGTRFINPYGPEVRRRWSEWKASLDAIEFDEPTRRRIVEAAQETFRLLQDVFDEVEAAVMEGAESPEVVV